MVDSHPVSQVESIVKPGYGGIFCFFQMKKFFAVLLCAICFVWLAALCSCEVDLSPFASAEFDAHTSREFDVYVCGAVENEGYIHILEGTDYQSLVEKAGLIAQTVMPATPYAVVDEKVSSLVLNYFDGAKLCYCTNVNGAAVTDRMSVENVSEEVINKLANYIAAHGKITDKTVLQQILGDDYAENFYKFYVSESDYEKN